MLEGHARVSRGPILVSLWPVPGMAMNSGTPTGWLSELAGRIVNVHRVCAPEIAAKRFLRNRYRHELVQREMENWRSPLASIPPSLAGQLGEHRATQVATIELGGG